MKNELKKELSKRTKQLELLGTSKKTIKKFESIFKKEIKLGLR